MDNKNFELGLERAGLGYMLHDSVAPVDDGSTLTLSAVEYIEPEREDSPDNAKTSMDAFIEELKQKPEVALQDIVSDKIKQAYAQLDDNQRTFAYSALRAIAKKARVTKGFDRFFNAFEKSVQTENPDNFVSIASVSSTLQKMGVRVRYNTLTKDAEVERGNNRDLAGYSKGGLVTALPVVVRDVMRREGYNNAITQNVRECISCIADADRYNPIEEFLGCKWDRKDRFPEIYRILGVTDEIYKIYIKKWFIQTAMLGVNDEDAPLAGEGCLTLKGDQGCGKTSFFRVIAFNHGWFCEGHVLDVTNKDSVISALRAWICELGELDSTLSREQSAIKAFLSKQTDRVRKPYDYSETQTPRRTSFCATVNPDRFLRDETGSRRFWVVPVTTIDKKALFALEKDWIQQLWCQSYAEYKANPSACRLSDDEMLTLQTDNAQFELPVKYETELRDLMEPEAPVEDWRWMRVSDIAKIYQREYGTYPDCGQLGRALTKIMKPILSSTGVEKWEKKVQGNPQKLVPILLR